MTQWRWEQWLEKTQKDVFRVSFHYLIKSWHRYHRMKWLWKKLWREKLYWRAAVCTLKKMALSAHVSQQSTAHWWSIKINHRQRSEAKQLQKLSEAKFVQAFHAIWVQTALKEKSDLCHYFYCISVVQWELCGNIRMPVQISKWRVKWIWWPWARQSRLLLL